MNYFHFKNIWKTISYQWFNPTREGWGLQFSTCYKNANAFLNSMYGKYLACLWLLPSSLFTVTLEEVDNWLQLPVWGDKMPLQKAFQHKILGSYYQSHDIWSYSNSYLPCLSRLSDSLEFFFTTIIYFPHKLIVYLLTLTMMRDCTSVIVTTERHHQTPAKDMQSFNVGNG